MLLATTSTGSPRFRGGKNGQYHQQVWILETTRLDLRRLGAALDRSCGLLVREAIDDALAKFESGVAPNPPAKPDNSNQHANLKNQRAVISCDARYRLQAIAFRNCCDCADLVREGIDDILRKYAHLSAPHTIVL